jgi:predicted Zn-dependent protease
MNRLNEALEPLGKAGSRNPRDARVPYLQGMVARALNQPREARAALSRFVAVAPSRFANLKSEALRALAELP